MAVPGKTTDYTDGRAPYDWQSKFPMEARKRICCEAVILAITLVILIFVTGLQGSNEMDRTFKAAVAALIFAVGFATPCLADSCTSFNQFQHFSPDELERFFWGLRLEQQTNEKEIQTSKLDEAQAMAEHIRISAELLHIPNAHPASAMIETAKSRGCDLIVMGSHGRRGLRKLFLGSQTAKVLADASVPVLVVHA
jgi:nucleotide-binding universal stress UspA family protein